MMIEIYINIDGEPFVLEHSLTRREVRTIQEFNDNSGIQGQGFLNLCEGLVKEETTEAFTICYIETPKSDKINYTSIIIEATAANYLIEKRAISSNYPEFEKNKNKEIRKLLSCGVDNFLIDCLTEDWIEKKATLFQDWLITMRHPNVFTHRPEIA